MRFHQLTDEARYTSNTANWFSVHSLVKDADPVKTLTRACHRAANQTASDLGHDTDADRAEWRAAYLEEVRLYLVRNIGLEAQRRPVSMVEWLAIGGHVRTVEACVANRDAVVAWVCRRLGLADAMAAFDEQYAAC